jgi:hypothetical protein
LRRLDRLICRDRQLARSFNVVEEDFSMTMILD